MHRLDSQTCKPWITSRPHRALAAGLYVLSGLFLFRVMAQLAQSWTELHFLPPFDAWHSGTLSYRTLFSVQILIVVAMIAGQVKRRALKKNVWLGKFLARLGVLYFATMLARLMVGLTIVRDHPWFGAVLPAVFHLVLASYVLLLAVYHRPPRG